MSPKDRFCPNHMHLRLECIVAGCSATVEIEHLTCGNPNHRAEEERLQRQSHTAMSQLKARALRAGIDLSGSGHTSLADLADDRPPHNESFPPANTPQDNPVSPVPGPVATKARMARRWTHNEQLFVMCCGVILSRGTFYTSEGLSGVKVCCPRPPSLPA